MGDSLKHFNEKRTERYQKDSGEEDFLLAMNRVLQAQEQAAYRDVEIAHPLIFIFGAPRSGTTLISQLIAHCCDAGFINNLMARFWLAPLHGIRLSRSVFGDRHHTAFQSDYARTTDLSDIHEYGYFWRHWLRKETLEDVTRSAEREENIDWAGLKLTLANMQQAFGKPLVFKNIFGSYHLRKMREVLGKVLYVYIERDPLDTAVSILDARRKYYGDERTWWSYTPLEYERLKDRDPWYQIAGQVFYLQRYYREQLRRHGQGVSLQVAYPEMCANPAGVLTALQGISEKAHGAPLPLIQSPPASFPLRIYREREEDKARFRDLFDQLAQENP